MSELYDGLLEGLKQAVDINDGKLNGKQTKYTFHIVPVKKYNHMDVKRIRLKWGMSQAVFANYLGVSIKTVEAWERGTNNLSGPLCRLLSIMEEPRRKKLPYCSRRVSN